MSLTARLYRYFQYQQQIASLTGRVEQAETYLRVQQRKLDELEEQKASLDQRRRHLAAAIGNLETEIAGFEQRMDHARTQMNSARTNKEYTALLSELNTFKADKEKVEEEVLGLMGQVDEIKAKIAELDGLLAERTKIRDVAAAQLEERRQAVSERLAELEAAASEAASEIPSDAMRRYEEAARLNDGEAMAEILELDARRHEYACGACHMTLPMETFSAVFGGQGIALCTSCHRLLYIGSELRESSEKRLAKKA